MSKGRYSRARRAIMKATAHYRDKKSRRNWKRFRKALARFAAL